MTLFEHYGYVAVGSHYHVRGTVTVATPRHFACLCELSSAVAHPVRVCQRARAATGVSSVGRVQREPLLGAVLARTWYGDSYTEQGALGGV